LALVYVEQGRPGRAEELWRESVQGRERVLGQGHPDTVVNRNNLIKLYLLQGRFADARPYLETALDLHRRAKPNAPATLQLAHFLVMAYHMQSQYRPAEQYYREALQGREDVLERDHPDTMQTR